MLTSLTIRNYALISNLEIDFYPGYSVLTGETGAGKSIIIGALSLILGQRADARMIKEGETKCMIEGVFDISSYNLKDFFEKNDLDFDPHHCILRRELTEGKSRAFINDSPVGLNELRTLATQLIDIHSQHQNLLLSDNHFQLQVLDALADNLKIRKQYQEIYKQYISLEKQLNSLKSTAADSSNEEEYLRFQFKQLEEAAIKEGEQEMLETEAAMLSNVEEIKSNLYQVEQILSNDELGIIPSFKDILNRMGTLNKIYPLSTEMAARFDSIYVELKDLYVETNHKQESLELDPERLRFVSERLDLIYSLQQKHKVSSCSDLLEIRKQIGLKLDAIDNYDEHIAKLEKELDEIYKKLVTSGGKLTTSRAQAAVKLEKELVKKVSPLGMPNMQFACHLTPKQKPDVTGMDNVRFLFSANKNAGLKPVADIASGGEIARLMLGIKALIADAVALPTIIFDEIDTGISGEVADKMSDIMFDMGKKMQVITITHLPQIAAKGSYHYFVYKEDINNRTETRIRQLSESERVKEIAQMLSGAELTQAAIDNAKNLLKRT